MQTIRYTPVTETRKVTYLNRSTGASVVQKSGPWSRTRTTDIDTKPDVVASGGPSRYAWRNPTGYARSGSRVADWDGTRKSEMIDSIYLTTTENFHCFESSLPPVNSAWTAPTASSSINMLLMAEVQALNRVKNVKANYAVAFAESQKFIDTVAQGVMQIAKSIKHAKRGRWKQAFRAFSLKEPRSRQVSSRWLELQYAWIPTLNDIYQMGKDFSVGFDPILTGKYVAKKEVVDFPSAALSGGLSYRFDGKAVYGWKVRLDYTATIPGLALARQMGLTNPLSILWELTPWSFVADWFVPVSDVINAMDAPVGLSFKGGSRTWFYDARVNGSAVQNHSSGSTKTIGYWQSTMEKFGMERSVYPGSPRPALYVKNPLSVGHALNALALLRQVVGSK